MKIGVLGPNGFIGFNLLQRYNWIPITREEINLLNKKSCKDTLVIIISMLLYIVQRSVVID